MRFNKLVGTLAAATISLTAMTGIANAQQITFAGAIGVGNSVFTYDDATGLSVTSGARFIASDVLAPIRIDPNSILSFTPPSLQNEGFLTAGAVAGDLNQNLTGGAFTLSNADTSEILLTGTFTDANLVGTVGQANGSFRVALGDVIYTGGTYFTTSGLVNPGEFSFGLTGVTPVFSGVAGGRFSDFTSGGSGTFSATAPNPIPEPSEWMAMGMAATSVGGLMFRARRRRQAAA